MSENKMSQDGEKSHGETPSSNEAFGIEEILNNPLSPVTKRITRLSSRVRPSYFDSDTLPRISITKVEILEQETSAKAAPTEQAAAQEEQNEIPANPDGIPPFRRVFIEIVDAPEPIPETDASRVLSRSELFERSRLPVTSSSEDTSNSEDEQM